MIHTKMQKHITGTRACFEVLGLSVKGHSLLQESQCMQRNNITCISVCICEVLLIFGSIFEYKLTVGVAWARKLFIYLFINDFYRRDYLKTVVVVDV